MANREACELFFEQEIADGLERKETPYQIGESLHVWAKDVLDVDINRKTIEKRAQRQKEKLKTNVLKDENTQDNNKLEEKRILSNKKQGLFARTEELINLNNSDKLSIFKKVGSEFGLAANTVRKKYYAFRKELRVKKENPERTVQELQKERRFWKNFPKKIETLSETFMECVFSPPSEDIYKEQISQAKDAFQILQILFDDLNNN